MDNNRFIIYKTLLSFEKSNREIKYLLNDQFNYNNNKKLNRKLITEIVYGSTRQKLNLDWKIKKFYKGLFESIDKELLVLLRMAVYQIFFCKSIPDYASVNSTVEISRKINPKFGSICNGVLRNLIRNKNIFVLKDFTVNELSSYYSHPKWIIEKWLKVWPKNDVIRLMEWNNKRPDIWFRFNNKKKSLNRFIKEFKVIKKNKYLDSYFTFDDNQAILKSKAFKNGDLSVQNPTSGIIAELLEIQSNDMILDACAAPGGKSKYIYEKMSKNNILTCLEINKHRYEILKNNFSKIANNLIIKNIDFLKFKSNILYDKILLDVPCIGTGVMSKRCDLRWLKKPEDIDKNRELLIKMLNKASSILAKKGTIVYSTCSIEKEDSSYIVNEFLKNNNKFSIERPKVILDDSFIHIDGSINIFPHKHGIDGGYAAKLVKND